MFNMKTELSSDDIRAMNKRLREIEPGLLKEMRKEIRQIAKPINDDIKRNIPSVAPMGGMASPAINRRLGYVSENNGRLSWSAGKKPNSTSILNRIKASGKSLTTALLSIRMNSAAASMSDMAGRVNKSRAISREYNYRQRDGSIVRRRHRVTTQGDQMIQNLGKKASRYGWPALENRLDKVVSEIDKVLQKYYKIANRGG